MKQDPARTRRWTLEDFLDKDAQINQEIETSKLC